METMNDVSAVTEAATPDLTQLVERVKAKATAAVMASVAATVARAIEYAVNHTLGPLIDTVANSVANDMADGIFEVTETAVSDGLCDAMVANLRHTGYIERVSEGSHRLTFMGEGSLNRCKPRQD